MVEQGWSETGLSKQVSDVLGRFASELLRYSTTDILRLMQREDLSLPRVVALMFLDRQGTASISDISNYLNLSLGNTSSIVDQLVCSGYVTRTEDPNDRRLKVVTLTTKGQAFVQEVKQARIAEMAQRLKNLPTSLLESTVVVMSAVLEHLQAERRVN
jgi:DNA-binding MarR family transcriptional regulator